jgi:hypothetical protein
MSIHSTIITGTPKGRPPTPPFTPTPWPPRTPFVPFPLLFFLLLLLFLLFYLLSFLNSLPHVWPLHSHILGLCNPKNLLPTHICSIPLTLPSFVPSVVLLPHLSPPLTPAKILKTVANWKNDAIWEYVRAAGASSMRISELMGFGSTLPPLLESSEGKRASEVLIGCC